MDHRPYEQTKTRAGADQPDALAVFGTTSAQITAQAAQYCRKHGLYDIEVTGWEMRAVTRTLVRLTRTALEALQTAPADAHRRKIIIDTYVHAVATFCRNVKLGTAKLGME